jgi:putative transposase
MAFWRLYYHLVWSTKNREPLIDGDAEGVLFPYMVAKAAEKKAFVYAVNGWVDHVHLVVGLPPSKTVAELVKELKGGNSHELNNLGHAGGHFAWQGGYGALTVGEKARPVAIAYVLRQKEHHTANTTRAWLERTSDYDDSLEPTYGPAQTLREDDPGYLIDDAPDF